MKNIYIFSIIALLFVSQSYAKKNVILIIPDGCSIPVWSAIRSMTVGTDGSLNIDKLPIMGRCKTYSANAMVTDSAASGTAYACGQKTNNGVLGMSAATTHGDSLTGQPIKSILEYAQGHGYATGVITTTMITHATPAVFYSHRADRDWYELIAHDLTTSGIDVIMGGGRDYCIPKGTNDEEGNPSKRTDSRNLISEMKNNGYVYVHDQVGFNAVNPQNTGKLLCLFNAGHMNYELDRKNDKNGEPALWEMTGKALEILSKDKKGFFLMVEAGRIDHAAHAHETDRFLWDAIACDKTVGVAADFARKNKDTLLIVVPDHGTGGPYCVGAYDKNGSVISYDDAGYLKYTLDENGFPASDGGKPIAIQWIEWGGHTGEDVGYFAMVNQKSFFGGLFGSKQDIIGGLLDNTDVNKIMHKFYGF
ncbi:MAG: alkaline phosphatase [Candidatus Latescibacteria bacterium]|nr:alkaline phosphatase [Candidatus Latescibacterota bacterium]